MSGSVSQVGKPVPQQTIEFNSRNPAGYNSFRVIPPEEQPAATKGPGMISASNAPLEKDGKKSTIFLLA
ncbi:MAG: hypothetical protein AAB880_01065 [Patescibacteria group bacterium]